jgi:hypothetical protein
VLESADRIGLPHKKIAFPPVAPYERQVGTLIDPNGTVVYIFVDGNALGLKTVTDAVNVACTLQPLTLYPVTIAPKWIQPAAQAAPADGSLSPRELIKRLPSAAARTGREYVKRWVRGLANAAHGWNVYHALARRCPAPLKRAVRTVLST